MSKRRIVLTSALPYANSDIHLGHLVEHFLSDLWIRFQRLRGHECYYLCADDTHGTPVMIAARKQGISPEQHIAQVWKQHLADFQAFQIHFDHYSSTNSEENRKLCEYFFKKMKDKGHISTKMVEQLYCENDKMFLPDRFVKGTCPKCATPDQYGDSCEKCGATYNPSELKNPYCSMCQSKPVLKDSEHLLFKLNDFNQYLLEWLPKHTLKEVANKMKEWFKEPLRDWDISRDEPYFGFQIPGHPGKYFYVWVDAPMGYVSTSKEHFDKIGVRFDDFWKSENSGTEIYHNIGKDIAYFHTLFWPALLKAADFRTPTKVMVHGFLTMNGERMSKSRGTFVQARTYLNHLEPAYLRYYFATKFNSGVDDLDFSTEDFIQRVNSDLIGKITNLGSRGAQMLGKQFQGKLGELDSAGEKLVHNTQKKADEIAAHYENWDFAKGINEIRALADDANRYFDEKAPWKMKDEKEIQAVLTATLNIFRLLSIYLKPIIPFYTEKVEKLMNEASYTWQDTKKILQNSTINRYEHLAVRIEPEKVKSMMDESKSQTPAPVQTADGELDIDTFNKVDLRVGKIIAAESVPEADKLLKLTVDLGSLGSRQIFAGIKAAYDPATLIGRLTVIVANLKPRKMKFGMSEGMVLAAGQGGKELFILCPDSGAKPGDKVK
jgi:methionyl-tRNA synthetase